MLAKTANNAQKKRPRSQQENAKLEMRFLVETIREKYGYDLSGCKTEVLSETLWKCSKQLKKRSLSALQERVLADEKVILPLLHELFSPDSKPNPSVSELSDAIEKYVIPSLRTYPKFKIWHLGCSQTKIMMPMLNLLAKAGIVERAQIYGTDLSLKEVEHSKKKIEATKKIHKKNICYFPFSFLTDSSFNEFQAVLVFSKFSALEKSAQEKIMGLLHDSIGRLGYLLFQEKNILENSSFKNFYKKLDETLPIYQRRA